MASQKNKEEYADSLRDVLNHKVGTKGRSQAEDRAATALLRMLGEGRSAKKSGK